MSLLIQKPARLLKNLREIRALGADGPSRRRLAGNMLQANLKRVHHGWSSLANRVLGTATVNVQLHFPAVMPFYYRPGTTDLLVLEQVFLDREYHIEPIAPESIEYIVDLGSNIGVTAMFWAQRYPNARMVLVEPDPDNFELLHRNTAAFQHRCTLLNAAVSDRRGVAGFFRSEREYGHSILRTDDCVAEIEVKTLTMSDVLSEGRFPRVDLLKMDIEGGESLVMPTIGTWKYAPRYLIAELHPPYDFNAFTEHCRSAGLRTTQSPDEEFRCNLPFAARAPTFN
ncbi:MAG TPA: FkbM family methyltransferase [Candidatus Acidoferrum sp.]|jgi:FkbM family methyltransferase|nr:FkbM family methyltransferase [Candidatus Acidoferrum sp.]